MERRVNWTSIYLCTLGQLNIQRGRPSSTSPDDSLKTNLNSIPAKIDFQGHIHISHEKG